MTNGTGVSVFEALTNVMQDVQGVGKHDKNSAQGWSFRGIDAVMNAVGPALRTHRVIVVPNVVDYEYATIEVGANRKTTGHARVKIAYTFYGPGGDSITATVVGEAMDSGDKATAKAHSVAFRTALLQALCLPTDEPDPDQDIYERSPKPEPKPEPMSDVTAQAYRDTIDAATDEEPLRVLWKAAEEAGDLHKPMSDGATVAGLIGAVIKRMRDAS